MARHLSLTVLCGLSVWFMVFASVQATSGCSAESSSSDAYMVSERRTRPAHTTNNTQEYRNGTGIWVKCKQSRSWVESTCLNGTWSPPWPTCDICMPNSTTSNGHYQVAFPKQNDFKNTSTEDYINGSEIAVRVVCDTGFRAESELYATCVNGAWSVMWPKCVPIPKCMPQSTQVGRYSVRVRPGNIFKAPSVDGYTEGIHIRVQVSCNAGYINQPSRLTTCQNGRWLEPWPTCEVLKCEQPATPSGSYSLSTSGTNTSPTPSVAEYIHGDALTVSIVCNDGYRIQPDQSTVSTSCHNGDWTVPWPTCEIVECISPTTQSGFYRVFQTGSSRWYTAPNDEYGHGVTLAVKIECNAGYQIHRSQSRAWSSCHNGEWSQQWPTCEIVKCLPPDASHGHYLVSPDDTNAFQAPLDDGYIQDTTLEIRVVCDVGYRSQSESTVRSNCQYGAWSVLWPTCEILKCMPPTTPYGQYMVTTISTRQPSRGPTPYGYIHGDALSVSLVCNDGYRIQPSQSTVSTSCQDGSWTVSWPTCVERTRCSRQSEETNHFTVQSLNDIASFLSGAGNDYRHGSEVKVTCRLGFVPEEPVMSVCNDGWWSQSWPTCVEGEQCSSRVTQWGSYSVNDGASADAYAHRTEVHVSVACDSGYRANPLQPVNILCRDGSWSVPWPQCVDVRRCIPATAEHGNYAIEYLRGTFGGFWDGNYADNTRLKVSVTCNDGYLAEPFVRTTCQLGTWSLPWPACERQQLPCEVPVREGEVRFFLNGDETRELHPYDSVPGGSFLAARCHDPGKGRLLGDSRRLCDYGEWLGEAPRCEIVAAAVLFNGLHRQVASNGTVVVFPINRPGSSWGNRLKVFCRKQQWSWSRPVISASSVTTSQNQREIILNSPTLRDSGNFTCTLAGSSHTVEVIFSEMYCPEPVITHGSVDKTFEWIPDRYPMKQEITFVCDDGYRLRPYQVYNNRHTCIMDQWSDDIPRCEPYLCPEPQVPANGRIHVVSLNRRTIGSRLEYFCNAGYVLVGLSNERRCEENAQWSADPPTCEAVRVRPRSPCESVTCESWKRCTVLYSGEAECTCINPFDCPYEPDSGTICGTDGKNYTSICRMKAGACLLRLKVDVATNNTICIDGLPEGEEDPVVNLAGDSASYSEWSELSEVLVTESQHTSGMSTVANQQTSHVDGGEPIQGIGTEAVPTTRALQTTANNEGGESDLFWRTTGLWESFQSSEFNGAVTPDSGDTTNEWRRTTIGDN